MYCTSPHFSKLKSLKNSQNTQGSPDKDPTSNNYSSNREYALMTKARSSILYLERKSIITDAQVTVDCKSQRTNVNETHLSILEKEILL